MHHQLSPSLVIWAGPSPWGGRSLPHTKSISQGCDRQPPFLPIQHCHPNLRCGVSAFWDVEGQPQRVLGMFAHHKGPGPTHSNVDCQRIVWVFGTQDSQIGSNPHPKRENPAKNHDEPTGPCTRFQSTTTWGQNIGLPPRCI